MKKNSKIMAFLTCLILIFSSILISSTSANLINLDKKMDEKERYLESNKENDVANWTYMYYLCCDNHIYYATENILNNLTKVGSSEDFHLVAVKDANEYGDSSLLYVEEGELINLDEGWPVELDMRDPITFINFVNFVKEKYTAKHYAMFILADAGSGWQGLIHDRSSDPEEGIALNPLPVFVEALKKVTNNGTDKLDVVVLSPCVMGMFEVAYALSPYFNYMVASEENLLEELDKGPEYVLPYLEPTWNLKNNTNLTPEEFACSIVNYYSPCEFVIEALYSYIVLNKKRQVHPFVNQLSELLTNLLFKIPNPEYHPRVIHTTLSAVNLSKAKQLAKSVDKLSSDLIFYLNDKDIRNCIGKARDKVREFGKFYPKHRSLPRIASYLPVEKYAFDSYIDLYDLARLINKSCENQLISQDCGEVMEKLEDMVSLNKVMDYDTAHGLSIYFPENKDLYNRCLFSNDTPLSYEEIGLSQATHWDELLEKYLEKT